MGEQRFVRMSEAARRLGLSRTRIYELAQCQRVPFVRLADQTMRVPVAWLDRLEDEAMRRLRETQ